MNHNTPISLTILTHNSLENLHKYFHWVDDCSVISEVVIIDDDSKDNIQKEIKKVFPKTKVIFETRTLDGDFASQHSFAISKTSNDWILWLDSDESASPDLISFLNNFDSSKYNYSFKRLDTFLGKKLLHGENYYNNFTRLFNKNYGTFMGKVHEHWQSSKPTTKTSLNIFHYPHPDLKTFFEKINNYSTMRAQELYENNASVDMFDIILYPIVKFVQNYFLKLGFLDSTPGIIMALGLSFHSFLVRTKLWQLHSSKPLA